MGKKDQRTKGNTKSASSSRSAQLLGNSTSFVGFGTSAESAFVPILQGAENDDGVPADFRLVLRKMHKKDVTTKVKALQEFQELAEKVVKSEDCSTGFLIEPSSEMVAVLPFWPAVYTKLAIDTDRRVRELSHLCLNLVVRGVGKQLATQLRSIAGVWFLAMTDPHQPAAQAAMAAWQTAFPSSQKQTNAVAYCHTEIVSSITENITTATPQTLSDPKVTPVEEMESKYVRTLTMSLSSLGRLLIEIEKSSSSSSTIPAINPLLDHPKFWKLAKHKVGSVRQAFFETIVQIGSSLPSLLETKGPSLVTCALGPGLQETDSGAAPAVWAAALQVLRLLPEAWNLITSPHKSVFPSVFKFIESGGGGGGIASSTFPSLLPFLSKVPAGVMGDPAKFLHRWFSCFRESLDSQSIVKQRVSADLRAVVVSYIECLFYCCSKEELDSGLKAGLVTDHLCTIFTRSLEEERLGSSGLQETVMNYLRVWDRQVDSKPSVAVLNNLFWADLKHRLVGKLDGGDGYEEVQKLLKVFKKASSLPEWKIIVEMDTLVMSLWNILVSQLRDGGSVEQVCSCLSLILPLLHKGLFNQLFAGPGEEADFLESTVLPLLQQSKHDAAICGLIWGLVCRLEPIRGAEIFSKLCGLYPTVIQHLLVAGGSGAGSSPMVVEWFSRENTIHWMLNLTKKFVEGDVSWLGTVKKILGLRLSLSASDMERFVQLLSPALEMSGKEDGFISQVEEVSEMVVLLLGQDKLGLWESDAGVDILMAIFRLDNGTETACKVQDKLEKAWSAGVRLVGGESRLVRQMVEEMKIQLGLLDQKLLQRLIGKGRGLLSSLRGDKENLQIILALMPIWSDLPPHSPESLLKQVVTQQFLLLESGLPLELEVPESPNLTRVKAAAFLSSLLLQYYSLSRFEGDLSTVSDSDRVKVDSSLVPHLTEIIFSLSYIKRLYSTPDTTSLRDQLDRQVSLLVSHLDKETSQQLITRVRGSSLQTGGLWADSLGWLVGLQYKTSEWDPRLPGLMPRVDSWSEGELATAVTVLSLSKELGTGCELVDQTLSVECGRLLSLGGLTNSSCVPLVWLVDHCARLCPQLDSMAEELAAVLGTFPVWRAESEEQLLYSRQLGEVCWSEASTVACVAHLLATTVERSPASLSPSVWDFACCSLVSWCASLEESRECLQTRPAVLMLGVAVCRLARIMGQLLGPLGHHPALAPPPLPEVDAELILPPRLREEWAEFFSEGVYSVLLPVYLTVCSVQNPGKFSHPLEKELCSALVHCPAPVLLSTSLPPLHLVQDVDFTQPLPDSLTFLYNHFGPLLLSPSRHIQVSAAHLLAAAAKETVAADDSSKDEEEERGLPRRLMEVISAGNTVLETVLQEFKVGESVGDIPPGNIVHIQTRGYLLAWRVVLNLVAAAGPELRPLYSQFLWTGGHLTSLLSHLFRLLPVSLHTTSLDLSLFTAPLTVTEQPSSRELVCLAGSCWMSVCRYLPALARMWYKEQDKAAQNVVEGVTSAVVTPVLWSEEARAIQTSGASMDNMELRVRGSVREVVATYTIDESSMELVVSLPANHPLDQVGVESGRRVGVETGQWRKWMLQLTTFLTHQNGTILDGLNLWKRNVDKRFEGVEECYICYYILHGSNHQLPKLACRTCKKKFHSACLYKWFSTSNNSTCPLCRNLF